jgi:hypothetical protein
VVTLACFTFPTVTFAANDEASIDTNKILDKITTPLPSLISKQTTTKDEVKKEQKESTPEKQEEPKNKKEKPKKEQPDSTDGDWKIHVKGAQEESLPTQTNQNNQPTSNQPDPFVQVHITGKVKGKQIEIQNEIPTLKDIQLTGNANVNIDSILDKAKKASEHWKFTYNGQKGTIDQAEKPKLKWQYDANQRPVAVQIEFTGKVGSTKIKLNKTVKVNPSKSKEVEINYKIKKSVVVNASLVDVTSGKGTWIMTLNDNPIELSKTEEAEGKFPLSYLKAKKNKLRVQFKGVVDEQAVTADKTITFDWVRPKKVSAPQPSKR